MGQRNMLGLQSFRKEVACLAVVHLRKEAFLGCLIISENSAARLSGKLMLKVLLVQFNCEAGARVAGTFGIFE